MNRPFIAVRPAEPADGDAIVRLERELADFERLEGPSDAEGRRLLAWIFDEKRFDALVAERGGTIVGIAIYFFFPTSFRARLGLYLEDIVVAREARGEGAGGALMAELARIAESRDCGRMEWAVLDWNERALDFYRRLGARQHREWLRYSLEAPEIRALAAAAEDESR
ncbi:MAG TPA: GNAT family N-acetyltransferase [Thermoanaerobaculia bacterium]|jgi:GNAT superfamily N-acetyltransferase|nr:GNAT family N-acetyltransferase [Thermoanaerobaculia bacterium]